MYFVKLSTRRNSLIVERKTVSELFTVNPFFPHRRRLLFCGKNFSGWRKTPNYRFHTATEIEVGIPFGKKTHKNLSIEEMCLVNQKKLSHLLWLAQAVFNISGASFCFMLLSIISFGWVFVEHRFDDRPMPHYQ